MNTNWTLEDEDGNLFDVKQITENALYEVWVWFTEDNKLSWKSLLKPDDYSLEDIGVSDSLEDFNKECCRYYTDTDLSENEFEKLLKATIIKRGKDVRDI